MDTRSVSHSSTGQIGGILSTIRQPGESSGTTRLRRGLVRFRRLAPSGRRLVIEAFLLNLTTRLGMWIVPLRSLWSGLRRLHRRGGGVESAGQSPDSCEWAVVVSSGYVPRATCLSRALALRTMLGRRGRDAEVRIGVAKATDGELDAHAWVELDGRRLLEGPEDHKYAVLPVFEESCSEELPEVERHARVD